MGVKNKKPLKKDKKICFKKNVNHFEVVITIIFEIFLSWLIQSPITQKLQKGDKKFSTLFEADEIALKITYLVSSVNP